MTNADKIRNMTDKELAEFIAGRDDMMCPNDGRHEKGCCLWESCVYCWQEWLKEEAEQTMPETKKQKTMMEDFFEKFPNAPRNVKGEPLVCPETIYCVEKYKDCGYPTSCSTCWSRPITCQRECYKNATVIVQYGKNGDPIISWVRQEDTERIGCEEAMKRVMKVKANE